MKGWRTSLIPEVGRMLLLVTVVPIVWAAIVTLIVAMCRSQ